MQEPSFNAWTIVFMISAAQALLLAAVFGWSHYKPNRLLAVILLLFACTMTEYVLYWTGYLKIYVHWSNISLTFPFLFGPLLWLYFRFVFEQRPVGWRDGWQALPFLAFLLAYLPYYLLSAAQKSAISIGAAPAPVPPWLGMTCVWMSIAHLFGYTFWHFIYLRRQPHVGQSNRWALWLNIFLFGYALAYTSYYVLVRFDFFNQAWDYHISLAMTLFIYLIAVSGYVRPAVFQGYRLSETAPAAKYRNSGLTYAAIQSLFLRLSQLMESEQLYRNPELNLDLLAHRLGASKHHVSQVINACTEGTFFDYVNRLRIEEAKILLAERSRSDLNVIEVAYAVGFNNKVSFNTAFKKVTGITPTAYRHQNARTDSTAAG
jgi:AraC-like DNA-binding protein